MKCACKQYELQSTEGLSDAFGIHTEDQCTTKIIDPKTYPLREQKAAPGIFGNYHHAKMYEHDVTDLTESVRFVDVIEICERYHELKAKLEIAIEALKAIEISYRNIWGPSCNKIAREALENIGKN